VFFKFVRHVNLQDPYLIASRTEHLRLVQEADRDFQFGKITIIKLISRVRDA
jgi:hypothetical protein